MPLPSTGQFGMRNSYSTPCLSPELHKISDAPASMQQTTGSFRSRTSRGSMQSSQHGSMHHHASESSLWSSLPCSSGERPLTMTAPLAASGTSWRSMTPSEFIPGSTSLLCGLTGDAESANSRAAARYRGSIIADASQSSDMIAAGEDAAGIRRVYKDEQEFVRATDSLSTKLDNLRKRLTTFEPPSAKDALGNKRGSAIGNNNSQSLPKVSSEEDGESLRERLEIYKMHRKVEPELPPLAITDSGASPKESADLTIVKRNTSREALDFWLPDARKERLRCRKDALAAALDSAAASRECQIQHSTDRWFHALKKKLHQGEITIQSRRSAGKKAVKLGEFARRWFMLIACANFADSLKEELRIRKMPIKERMQSLKGGTRGSALRNSDFVAQTLALQEVMSNPQVRFQLAGLAIMFHSKLRLRDIRRKAALITNCLGTWKLAGRICTTMRGFALRMKQVQRWWRKVQPRLVDYRDTVSFRWQRIERQELTRELNKAIPIETNKSHSKKRGPAPPKLSLEEKLQLHLIEESVRLNFIENELRARRYFLLPKIDRWQQDTDSWRKAWLEWRACRVAHKSMGSEDYLNLALQLPPLQPSYMPPNDPQGDREILDMWKRCRKNKGGGWMVISEKLTRERKKAPKNMRGKADDEKPEKQKSAFGDPPEDDLRQFEVNFNVLPGLARGGKPTACESDPSMTPC